MTDYALLVSGVLQRIGRYDARPEDIPHKGVEWHPVVNETGEAFQGLVGDNWVIRTPDPATLPPPVPYVVTPRQVRLLLLQQGLLADVEAMIASQDAATKITWEYALEFRRDDPLLNQLAANLNLTEQQIDQFFIAASAL